MATVDNLQIQINAQSVKANEAIDRLVIKLDRLTTSLSKVSGSSLTGLADGVQRLGTAMQTMNNVKTGDFKKISSGIERLSSIQAGNMEVVGNALKPFAEGINVLSNSKFDNKNLQNLINSLTRLSNANVANLSNIDFTGIGNSIKQFATSLSDTPKIQQSVISMTNAVANLSKSGTNIPIISTSLGQLGTAIRKFISDMSLAPSVSENVISFTQSIATLANAGDKTAKTASNLSNLAKELKKFMQTMSSAPSVNSNTIQMTNALANLASQGSRVGTASNSMVRGLNNSSTAATKAKKSFGGLAAAFGKFYASYFLVIRGIKKLFNSIESTTDYIEAFNYQAVTFSKIGSEWGKDFEKYGYENAESYSQSFLNRVNDVLGKMSGLKVDIEGGLLTESGTKNLGLNIQKITQYASQLASVTNSLGQTAEISTAVTKSMTMLAGDISSLFNVDYSTVANNLQSGLIGMSRSLYKYGIDITNATLQTYAYELGLSKAVSEMTQAEKQQLRVIAILDQSKVSWGDLANTINSPSNMLRQFTNNLKEAGMILGQLFIPLLNKVMPVLNGITIAIKRLLVNIANLMGIKINFEDFGQSGYKDTSEGIDDVTDSLENATSAAEEYKNELMGFDEINKLSDNSSGLSTGGGAGSSIDLTDEILKATEEYEKAWNEAFANMENEAQKWADKIEKILNPIMKIFKDFSVGDFFQAGQDVSKLVISITDFFSRAIDSVDWYGIGEKIGDFLDGLDWIKILKSTGKAIWKALKAVLKVWKGAFDAAPIETGIITAVSVLKFTKLGTILTSKINNSLDKAAKGLNLKKIGVGIATALGEFTLVEDAFEGLVSGSQKAGSAIGEITIATGTAFGALKMLGLSNPWTALIVGATGLVGLIAGVTTALDEGNTELNTYIETSGKYRDEINKTTEEINNSLSAIEESWDASAKIDEIDALKTKYFELADQTNLTAGEQETLKRLAEELIELVPDLNGVIDTQTGYYKGTREEVEKLIDKTKEYYRTQALQDAYVESVKEEFNAKKNLKQAEDVLADSKTKLLKAQKELNEFQSKGFIYINKNLDKYYELSQSVSKLTKEVNQNQQAYDDASVAWQRAADDMEYTWEELNSTASVNMQEMEQNAQQAVNNISANLRDTQSNIGAMFLEISDDAKKTFSNMAEVGALGGAALKDNFTNNISGIPTAAINAFNAIIQGVNAGNIGAQTGAQLMNSLADTINNNSYRVKNALFDTFSSNFTGEILDAQGNVKRSAFNMRIVPKYATGGFPEDGLFFANRGELVGQFSNGKTAVANNEQITEGIANAVYPAVYNAVMAAMSNTNTQGGDVVVQIDGQEVFRSTQKYASQYLAMTGQPAFEF